MDHILRGNRYTTRREMGELWNAGHDLSPDHGTHASVRKVSGPEQHGPHSLWSPLES